MFYIHSIVTSGLVDVGSMILVTSKDSLEKCSNLLGIKDILTGQLKYITLYEAFSIKDNLLGCEVDDYNNVIFAINDLDSIMFYRHIVNIRVQKCNDLQMFSLGDFDSLSYLLVKGIKCTKDCLVVRRQNYINFNILPLLYNGIHYKDVFFDSHTIYIRLWKDNGSDYLISKKMLCIDFNTNVSSIIAKISLGLGVAF